MDAAASCLDCLMKDHHLQSGVEDYATILDNLALRSSVVARALEIA